MIEKIVVLLTGLVNLLTAVILWQTAKRDRRDRD
jgi:hypothetical protein